MIRGLRYIGVHLWLTILFAGPASFYIITQFSRLGLAVSPVFFSVFIFIVVGFLIGFSMNTAAKMRIVSLIKEGQAWERSGIAEKAKRKYIQALRVYDTFLLWPFSAKKTAQKITGVIAGFSLNNPVDNQNFKLGTAVYLKMNPLDADMAVRWLSQISQANIVSSFEQEVLYTLAGVHMENRRLIPLFANIFLGLRRSDLVAKRVYQQVMAQPALVENYQSRITELTDEPEDNPIRQAFFDMPEQSAEQRSELSVDIFQFISGFPGAVKAAWRLIRVWIKSGSQYAAGLIRRAVLFFKARERVRFFFKTIFLIIFLSSFIFFIVSTIFHMFKPQALEQKNTIQEKIIPKPFTIQVAAYLKQEHAKAYVDVLKKRQVDASIKKVEGGGKNWFVITVSAFTDKKSASEYGDKLKQQHIIDDFFVNNR